MFPLTHMAVTKEVLKRENSNTVFGSVFPDFVTYLGMGRNLGHELGNDLYYYTLEHEESMVDFALGVLSHGTSLPGLDAYADENYHNTHRGFCFMKGDLIADRVHEICKVPKAMASWKAHNFIEIGFDIVTAKKEPDIKERAEHYLLEGAFSNLSYLSKYLSVGESEIKKMFIEVPKQFCFDGYDIEEFTKKYLDSLKYRHGIVGADLKEAVSITEEAVAIVEPIYDEFMPEVIDSMTKAMSKYPKVWA